MKKLISILLALTLFFGMSTVVLAADPAVEYEGGAEKFVFIEDHDLFDNFKGLFPGDTVSQKITVKNDYRGRDYIKVYMKAVTPEEVPPTETQVSMQDFLSQLSMTVYNGSEKIYEASPDELDGLKNWVLLGTFDPGEKTELNVDLLVPIELGNKYQNRVGYVKWIFMVEELDHPDPQNPQTGDHSMIGMWTGLMVLSAAGMVLMLLSKKKNKA